MGSRMSRGESDLPSGCFSVLGLHRIAEDGDVRLDLALCRLTDITFSTVSSM